MATYLSPNSNETLRGEVVFSTPEWTHLMVEGTDTIAVVPTEDVYPM